MVVVMMMAAAGLPLTLRLELSKLSLPSLPFDESFGLPAALRLIKGIGKMTSGDEGLRER